MNLHFGQRKTGQTFILLIAACLGGCGSEQPGAEDVQRYIHVSQSYLDSGQLRAALIEANNAISIEPDAVEPHMIIARIQREKGNYSSAIQRLENVAPTEPSPEYIFLLADLYEKSHQPFKAINTLTENEDLLSGQGIAYSNALANAHFRAGDPAKSEALYRSVLAESPNDGDANIGLARLAITDNDHQSASQQLQKFLEQSPAHVDAMFMLGNIQTRLGRHEEATSLFTDALSELPSTDTLTLKKKALLEALSASLTKQGKLTEAYIYSSELAELDPLTAEFREAMYEAQRFLGEKQYDDAEKILLGLYEKFPHHPEVNQYLGLINLMQGKNADAQKYLVKGRKFNIGNPSDKALSASVHMHAQNHDLVLRMLAPEIQAGSDDPDINALYGFSLLGTGDSKGLEFIEKSLAIKPDNGAISTTLAGYHIENRQPQKAIDVLRSANEANPHDVVVYDALITTLIRNNMNQEAVDAVKQVIRDNPADANAYALAGRVGYAVGDRNAARQGFEQALKLDAKNLPGLYGIAQLALHDSDATTALDAYKTIIDIEPQAVNAYKGIAGAMEMAGRESEIETMLRQFSDQYPESGVPAGVLAEYYLKNSDYNSALQVLATSRERVAGDAYLGRLQTIAFVSAAQNALKTGDFNAALERALEGLTVVPNEQRLYNIAIKAGISLSDYPKAERLIDSYAKVYPADYRINEFRGDLNIHQGAADTAIDFYKRAFDISPNDATGLKIFRVLKVDSTKNSQLEAFLESWTQKLPGSIRALTLKANLLESKGKIDEAIAAYQGAQTLEPNNSFVLSALALLYEKKNLSGALELAEKAYSLTPDRYYTADALGWVLIRNGDHQTGLRYLEQALALAPDSRQIKQHLAEARKAGQK